jgi:hypothetical protein
VYSIVWDYVPQSFTEIWHKMIPVNSTINSEIIIFLSSLPSENIVFKISLYSFLLAWKEWPDSLRYQNNWTTFKTALLNHFFNTLVQSPFYPLLFSLLYFDLCIPDPYLPVFSFLWHLRWLKWANFLFTIYNVYFTYKHGWTMHILSETTGFYICASVIILIMYQTRWLMLLMSSM